MVTGKAGCASSAKCRMALVMPFRKTVDMGDYTYYLLTPSHRPESATMQTFRLWLLGQFTA